jgi:hypothetical protein
MKKRKGKFLNLLSLKQDELEKMKKGTTTLTSMKQ